jgi:hypothetical protein
MSIDKQLDLWPESTGDDKDKRPGTEDFREDEAKKASAEPEAENVPKMMKEDKPEPAEEKYRPDAAEILKHLNEAPGLSPEEIIRQRTEYAKRVYPDQPIETVDKAAEHAEIEKIRANLQTMLNSDLKAAKTKINPGAVKPNDEREDPWSEINPPIMRHRLRRKK